MRVIALLCLIFGTMAQLLLNGQPFSNAIFGMLLGAVAVVCGMVAARKDPPNRWEGRIMAILGAVLAACCIVLLPSGYHVQKNFNATLERIRLKQQQDDMANNVLENTGTNAPDSQH